MSYFQYFDNVGEKGKQKLKEGYSFAKTAGAEAVYHRPETKGGGYGNRWGGKDSPQRQPGRSAMTIYKVPKQKAPAPAPKPKPKPKPKAKPKPIEYSPEIQQAKDRVNAYESDKSSPWEQAQANVQSSFISGKSSEDIYGNNDYSFDATKGSAGIGASSNNSSNTQTETAAASFLDKKKFDLKSSKQFQPS